MSLYNCLPKIILAYNAARVEDSRYLSIKIRRHVRTGDQQIECQHYIVLLLSMRCIAKL